MSTQQFKLINYYCYPYSLITICGYESKHNQKKANKYSHSKNLNFILRNQTSVVYLRARSVLTAISNFIFRKKQMDTVKTCAINL